MSPAAKKVHATSNSCSLHTWGIRDNSVSSKVHIPGDPDTGLDLLQSMQVGDVVVFGTDGPSARPRPRTFHGRSCRDSRVDSDSLFEDDSPDCRGF